MHIFEVIQGHWPLYWILLLSGLQTTLADLKSYDPPQNRSMILHRLAHVLQTDRHKLDMPYKFYVLHALNFIVFQYVRVVFFTIRLFLFILFFVYL